MSGFELTAANAPAAVGGIGSILGLVGNMSAASGARTAGARQQQAADFEASQLDQQAGQSVAASQRAAMDEERRARLLASRGIAVAAAGGGAVTDPTISKLLADISGEGAYRASVALYQGEERARQQRLAANVRRYEGDVALEGGGQRADAFTYAGLGNLATGGASLWAKYGMGGPKKNAASAGNGWLDAGSDSSLDIG